MSNYFWRVALLIDLIILAVSVAISLPSTAHVLESVLFFAFNVQPPLMAALTLAALLPIVGFFRDEVLR